MIELIKKNLHSLFVLLIVVILFLGVSFYYIFSVGDQQFTELANSFLHFKLYFLDNSLFNQYLSDNVYFNGRYYWPLGPLPAVILSPFVWLGNIFNFYFLQGYLNLILVLAIIYLVIKLAHKINYSISDSIYWSIAFVFSSMFLGVAVVSSSWYFAQTITVFLLFLALLEYFGRKRFFWIGLFFGLILITRVTAFLGIVFILLDIIFDKNKNWRKKIEDLLLLGLVPVICFFLLCGYNYARFNNIFDQGYRAQILDSDSMRDKEVYGLFNLQYLPRSIYYSIINMPSPVYSSSTRLLVFPFIKADPWGMSIFLTSPYLIYLFFLKFKKQREKILIFTSFLVWLLIASSFFIGYRQFGFRYALDFFPLLFTALMISYKYNFESISLSFKITIVISALFNFYLLLNI